MTTARKEHRFQFSAKKIAEAAAAEAEYHKSRSVYWHDQYTESLNRVKQTVRVEVKEVPITGGVRPEVYVDHGDLAAYRRMQESFEKIGEHNKSADDFLTQARIYTTQEDRVYELDMDDVQYFRLGGEARPA